MKTIKELLIKLDFVSLFSFFYVLRSFKRADLPIKVEQSLCHNSVGVGKVHVSGYLHKYEANKTLKKACKIAKLLCFCKTNYTKTIYMYWNKPEQKTASSETGIVLFKYVNTIKPLTYKCFYDLIYEQA